jgi:putative ABC transport system permease protein
MFRIALRDLQYRKRRLIVVVIGAAFVLALSLVNSGISSSFSRETDRTLNLLSAPTWMLRSDAPGPFTTFAPLDAEAIARATEAATAAGGKAGAVLIARQTVADTIGLAEPASILLFGVEPGKIGSPEPKRGSPLTGRGQIIVDDALGYGIGDEIPLGDTRLKVVGTVTGASMLAGTPAAFVSLDEGQAIMTEGAAVATAVLTDAQLSRDTSIAGMRVLKRPDIKSDGMRLLRDAQKTISMIMGMLWGVAALIVGSAIYLSALERSRDMAVMKATGASTGGLAAGILIQALIVSFVAAVIGAVLAVVLAPVFPMNVEIPSFGFILLAIVAIVVAALASLAGLRRAVRIDPALAFGGP